MSRSEALRRYKGKSVVDYLAARGILIRSPSMRGVAEEAPGAYKDVSAVVEAAEGAGLARTIARLTPLLCVKVDVGDCNDRRSEPFLGRCEELTSDS